MGHGFFWAIPGPTLPSLEDNVGEDNVSTIFSYRALGQFVGACICGFFFPRITAGKWKLFSIGFVLILDALGLAIIPIGTGLLLNIIN